MFPGTGVNTDLHLESSQKKPWQETGVVESTQDEARNTQSCSLVPGISEIAPQPDQEKLIVLETPVFTFSCPFPGESTRKNSICWKTLDLGFFLPIP